MSAENDNNQSNQLFELLIRVDERVKNLESKIDDYRDEVTQDVDKIDERLTKLEKFSWKLTGIITVVSFIIASGVSLLIKTAV